jgi:hypothetical protein
MGLKIAQVPSPDFTGEKTSVSGLFIFAITEVARTCPPLLLARTPPGQTPVYRHRPADLKKGLKSNGGYRPCLLRTLPKYGRSSGK